MADSGERLMRSYAAHAVTGQARGLVLRAWDEEWTAARAEARPLEPPRFQEVAERVARRVGVSVEAAMGTQQSSYLERLEADHQGFREGSVGG